MFWRKPEPRKVTEWRGPFSHCADCDDIKRSAELVRGDDGRHRCDDCAAA